MSQFTSWHSSYLYTKAGSRNQWDNPGTELNSAGTATPSEGFIEMTTKIYKISYIFIFWFTSEQYPFTTRTSIDDRLTPCPRSEEKGVMWSNVWTTYFSFTRGIIYDPLASSYPRNSGDDPHLHISLLHMTRQGPQAPWAAIAAILCLAEIALP